jgi:hypothetical protein
MQLFDVMLAHLKRLGLRQQPEVASAPIRPMFWRR